MKYILLILLANFLLAEGDLFNKDLGNEPTVITSDKLNFDANERQFTYTSNVVVIQKDLKMTTDKIIGKYDKNNKIESLTAIGNVVITQGIDLKATCRRAVYQTKDETLTLTENPELTQKGSILNADKIIIYIKENRSEALGTISAKLVQ